MSYLNFEYSTTSAIEGQLKGSLKHDMKDHWKLLSHISCSWWLERDDCAFLEDWFEFCLLNNCMTLNSLHLWNGNCSVTQSRPALCDPTDCSTPGFPVLHLPELAQTHVHWAGDAILPSHPLSSPPPAFNLSKQKCLFQRVGSSHQMAKVLELQLQH